MFTAVGEFDQFIHAVVAVDILFIIAGLDLGAKHIAEQLANHVEAMNFMFFIISAIFSIW